MNSIKKFFLLTVFFVSPACHLLGQEVAPPPTYGDYNPPPTYGPHNTVVPSVGTPPPSYESIWSDNGEEQSVQENQSGIFASAQGAVYNTVNDAVYFAEHSVRVHPKRTALALLGACSYGAYTFPRATRSLFNSLGSLMFKVMSYSPKTTGALVLGGAGYIAYKAWSLRKAKQEQDELYSLY